MKAAISQDGTIGNFGDIQPDGLALPDFSMLDSGVPLALTGDALVAPSGGVSVIGPAITGASNAGIDYSPTTSALMSLTSTRTDSGTAGIPVTSNVTTAFAPLVITPIFGSSITNLGTGSVADPTTTAEVEAAINDAISYYQTDWTSSVPVTITSTVSITIDFNYGGLSGNGASTSAYGLILVRNYASLFAASSAALPKLSANDPTNGGTFVETFAQSQLLGDATHGVAGTVDLNTIANGATLDYNLANQSIAGEIGAVGAVEHEIAEVFGRFADLSNVNIGGAANYSILDLYRYSAAGVPALTAGPSDYFSLNGGTTRLGYFNNLAATGGDAGDWASSGVNNVPADAFDAFLTTGTAGTISALDTMVLANIGLQARPLPPRTLAWTGAQDTNFANAADWNDSSDNLIPASAAPNTGDTASFTSGGGLVTGTGTVAALAFGGGGGWHVGSAAAISALNTMTIGDSQASTVLINQSASVTVGGTATIASQSSASGSSVNVVGSGSNWQVSGALVIGNAATGSLDIAAAGSVAAASIDTGAAAAGAGIITVSGTSTSLSTTGSLIVGDLGTGELSVLSGAQLSAANITIGAQTGSTGNVDVEGNATQLTVSGTVTIGGLGSGVFTLGSGTTLTTGGGVFTTINGVFNQSGEVDPPHVVNDGQTNLSKGARTLADISIENSNEYTLQNGAATMYTPLITFDANPATDQGSTQGTWLISNAGTLVLNADTVDASQTIDFSATNAVLEIGQHPSVANGTITGTVAAGAANVLPGFGAPIENYRSGDKITFPGLTFGSDTASGNVVTLWSGLAGTGTQLGSLDFITPSGAPDSAGALLADTQIATLACFAEGTRVRTVAGLVRVEALSVGDRVVTQDGVEQPVVWIGSRTVDCARHTTPETVWPVRVEAGAFGENVPVRDLYLSPDHAVFVDGVLVPVKLLINGGTIEQVKRRTVTYYHVELPAHDVILAEDLPVESYLDTGDRGNFEDEHVVRLFPDFDARPRPEAALVWETKGCAELVMAGERLEEMRAVVTKRTRSRSTTVAA